MNELNPYDQATKRPLGAAPAVPGVAAEDPPACATPGSSAECMTPAQPEPRWAGLRDAILAGAKVPDLAGLDGEELLGLHWDVEREFARRIQAAPKGSSERNEAVRRAYDAVNHIVHARMLEAGEAHPRDDVRLGVDRRYGRLVADLLSRWQNRGYSPRFFEIGFGSGTLLAHVQGRGFVPEGIEVSPEMHAQARCRLGRAGAARLLLGEFLRHPFQPKDRFHLIYWNDVFEHIPPDQIAEYLRRIHSLLVPGGQLLTITPNWHTRPSDVTGDVCAPRTEPAGLHLKEYTLREVTRLLRAAGFQRVDTPLLVTRRRVYLWGGGLGGLKRALEPLLEWLPFRAAVLCCRAFGMSLTLAQRGPDA